VNAAAVGAWLAERYPTIGADQRAAIVGIASSDAALTQLVGPAGTGKSYAAGALTGVWQQLAGGRVHGLAVSQNAAEILREDGVPDSANVTAWLASQDRLEAGRPLDVDLTRAVGPKDVVLVDEASMVGTMQLDRVRSIVDSMGARLVLMGDPRQLGAVGAGGAMDLVADRAETHTLSDVRRFAEPWEAAASLRLRDGDREALADYDRHGRLVEAATMDDAIAAAARAAAADRLAGLDVVVSADTNDDAARIADAVREHLVAAGVVEADGVPLARTGSLAGLGDEIMTRQNDYDLGVINRQRFRVVGSGIDQDGRASLSVLGADGAVRELPAGYVDEHVQLAYGSTVHAAQGATVDRGYVVTDGRSDAAALYVGLTRGRDRNTAIVALQATDPEAADMTEDGAPRPTARSVLEGGLEREDVARAALVEAKLDAAREASMRTVIGRMELFTGEALRARLEGDLDRLVADGVLSVEDRARLAADQSSEHLSRLLRAGEQAGHDPAQLLREAIGQRPLDDAESVAQVLSHRITSAHDLAAAHPHAAIPERLPAAHANAIEQLQEQAADRVRELGSQVAEQQPAWATKHLGALPADAVERLEWEAKAGVVAAYREAVGFEEPNRAIPSAPGLTATEKRAAWWNAWDALSQPSETRAEAALSDGQLRARITAWQRKQQWAPAHADASMRDAELRAEQARTDAILADAAGDKDRAAELRGEAERLAGVARGTSTVADARARWATQTAVTRDLAERAERELTARGLTPGAEEDRIDAETWLAEQQRAVEAEDAHRPVTELDVPFVDEHAAGEQPVPAQRPVLEEEVELGTPSPAHDIAPVDPDDLELAALVHTATEAEDRLADRESQEAAHDALDAELLIAPEHDHGCDVDLGDAIELPAPTDLGALLRRWPDED
jgi:AAA domain